MLYVSCTVPNSSTRGGAPRRTDSPVPPHRISGGCVPQMPNALRVITRSPARNFGCLRASNPQWHNTKRKAVLPCTPLGLATAFTALVMPGHVWFASHIKHPTDSFSLVPNNAPPGHVINYS